MEKDGPDDGCKRSAYGSILSLALIYRTILRASLVDAVVGDSFLVACSSFPDEI